MNELNEIRKYAGINEYYLTEGIVFFKNSNKINRLSKRIGKKKEYYMKKGKYDEAELIGEIQKEFENIYNVFKKIEQKYKKSSKIKKESIKQEYKEAEKYFDNILKITNDSDKSRILKNVGLLGITAGILFLGSYAFAGLIQSGSINIDNVARNLESRSNNMGITQQSSAGSHSGIQNSMNSFVNDQIIKATNDDLLKSSAMAGSTATGVIAATVGNKMHTIGKDNTLIGKAAAAIRNLKNFEKQKDEKDHQSGEGDDK